MLLGARGLVRYGTARRLPFERQLFSRVANRHAAIRAPHSPPGPNESFANEVYEKEMRRQWRSYRWRRACRGLVVLPFLAVGVLGVIDLIWRFLTSRSPDAYRIRMTGRRRIPMTNWKYTELLGRTLSGKEFVYEPEAYLWPGPVPGGVEWISAPWLGPKLVGWPGVVHGGVIATVLSDAMGQAVDSLFPTGCMLVSYEVHCWRIVTNVLLTDPIAQPASLRVDYHRPCPPRNRVVVVVRRHHHTADPAFVSIPSPGSGKLNDPRPPPVDTERTVPRVFLSADIYNVENGKIVASAMGSFDIPERFREKGVEVDVEVSKRHTHAGASKRLSAHAQSPMQWGISWLLGRGPAGKD